MKILFWKHATQLVSGSDQQLFCYAAHLRAAGHRPAVLLLHSPSAHDSDRALLEKFGVPARLRELDVPVWTIVDNFSYRALWRTRELLAASAARLPLLQRVAAALSMKETTYRTMVKILRRWRPDVAHVLDPREGRFEVLRAARATGTPVLYHELRTPPDTDTPEDGSWYTQMDESLALCTAVAALSPRHAQLWCERLGYRGSISVLPLMTDPPLEAPKGPGRPPGHVIFGYAGIMHRPKGLVVLLEAMALLLRQFPEARLRLAGWGPYLEDLKARANALGIAASCEFAGAYFSPEQCSAFMRGLDVFVLPSFAEGTPNSIVEAMAHELPVVASAVGGIPDMISPDVGVLVPPGDRPTLAAALLRLAGDPGLRARMGGAARKRYEWLFSPEAVMPVLLDTYQRLALSNGKSIARATSTGPCSHPWAEPPDGATQREKR